MVATCFCKSSLSIGVFVPAGTPPEIVRKLYEATVAAAQRPEFKAALAREGTEVTLCGLLTGIQRKRNKEGKPWASMQIEDLEGSVEAMVFSTQFERLNPSLVEDKAVLVRGLVLPEENAPPKISIQEIVPLEVARVHLPSLISIKVPVNGAKTEDCAEALRGLFQAKPGETEVRLRLEKPRDFSVILDVATKVRPDKEFRSELERICGPEALEILANE